MKFASLLLVALAAGPALAAAPDTGDMRIGVHAMKPEEVPKAIIDETVKKLSVGLTPNKKPADPAVLDTGWEKSADAAKFAAEARSDPAIMAIYQRISIPPIMPNAVPYLAPDVRARADWILGLSGDRRAMDALLAASVYDAEEFVRFAATKALVMLEEPIALRKLVDVATSHDIQRITAPVRKNAAVAIRRYGDKEGVDRILREVAYELAGGNTYDPHNRPRGGGKGLGTGNPMGLDDTAPPDLHLSEQDLYPALSAMKEVTGQSFPTNEKEVKTWTDWWTKTRDKFAFKD